MPDKIPNMVAATSKRPIGRPRKFRGSFVLCHIKLPIDLLEAIERHQDRQHLGAQADAHRDLLREAAERRGLVERRPD